MCMLQLDHEHGSTTTTSTCTFSCVCVPLAHLTIHHNTCHIRHPSCSGQHTRVVWVSMASHTVHTHAQTQTPHQVSPSMAFVEHCVAMMWHSHHTICLFCFVCWCVFGGKWKSEERKRVDKGLRCWPPCFFCFCFLPTTNTNNHTTPQTRPPFVCVVEY